MTPTELQLLAVHKAPTLKLIDICGPYLGLSYPVALRKASSHELPFPAYRPIANQRSPWMVKVEDLATFIDAQAATAQVDWANSQV
jgi:hypothetical protein